MAFHPYPQLLRALCHGHRFGPPRRSSQRFSLARGSSPGFGSAARDSAPSADSLALRLRVPLPSPRHERPLAGSCSNRHAVTCSPQAPTAWGRVVSGALSPPSPGSFSPVPHGTRPLSVGWGAEPWRVVSPASCRGPRARQYSRTHPGAAAPPPTGLSPSPVAPSSRVRLAQRLLTPCSVRCPSPMGRTTPHQLPASGPPSSCGLGSARFARHYSGPASRFLGVLRCFTSPGALLHHRGGAQTPRLGRLPHSDTPGSPLARSSPGRFAARPRPSSAPAAKASTTRPPHPVPGRLTSSAPEEPARHGTVGADAYNDVPRLVRCQRRPSCDLDPWGVICLRCPLCWHDGVTTPVCEWS